MKTSSPTLAYWYLCRTTSRHSVPYTGAAAVSLWRRCSRLHAGCRPYCPLRHCRECPWTMPNTSTCSMPYNCLLPPPYAGAVALPARRRRGGLQLPGAVPRPAGSHPGDPLLRAAIHEPAGQEVRIITTSCIIQHTYWCEVSGELTCWQPPWRSHSPCRPT